MLFKFVWTLLTSVLIFVMAVSSRDPAKHDVKPNLPRWMDTHQTIQREAAEYSFDQFHDDKTIYDQIEKLNKINENVKIGNLSNELTIMERNVKLISITTPPGDKSKLKTRIFVVAGVHGRDWYSVAAAMYLVHQLTISANQNTELLEQFDWFIVPLMNPDGYNLTQSNNFPGFKVRDWKKNCYQEWVEGGVKVPLLKESNLDETKYFNYTCPVFNQCGGIDIEKNYEYQWINFDFKALYEKKITLCENNFPGYKRHSARESDDFTEVMGEENSEKVTLFINIREGGSAVAYPYCYTKREFEYMEDMEKLTKKAGEAGKFGSGARSELFPLSAGDIEDYVESHFSIRNSISLYIKEYTKSKHLTRGGKIKTRSRRVFKAIEALALNHKHYMDPQTTMPFRGGQRSQKLRFRAFMRPDYRLAPQARSDGSADQPVVLTTIIGLVWITASMWTYDFLT